MQLWKKADSVFSAFPVLIRIDELQENFTYAPAFA